MIIRQNSRIQHHRITDTGTVFTVPGTEDFTDGSWSITDLMLGEIGIQMTDDKVYVRTTNGILELQSLNAAFHGEVDTAGGTLTSILEFQPTGKCVISVNALVAGADTALTAVAGVRAFGTFYYDGATTMVQLGSSEMITNSLTGMEGAVLDTDGINKVRVQAQGLGGVLMHWSADIRISIKYL